MTYQTTLFCHICNGHNYIAHPDQLFWLKRSTIWLFCAWIPPPPSPECGYVIQANKRKTSISN